jgi:signal peptidase I
MYQQGDLNLEDYLWIAVALTCVFWIIGKIFWGKQKQNQQPWIVEFFGSFFPILIAIMLLRSFIIEPFRIPSASMEPTLYAGDMIAVKKWTYGLKMPITGKQLTEGRKPERGDIAVFKKPGDDVNFFIKRVVAIPGDKVVYANKQLSINGKVQGYELLEKPSIDTDFRYMVEEKIEQDGEFTAHKTFFSPEMSRGDNKKFTIPEGHYMMMGDNRDNSLDSRFWGMVPEKRILGEAAVIWMNLKCVTFKGSCDHIGTVLQ